MSTPYDLLHCGRQKGGCWVVCLFYSTVLLFGRRPILEDGALVGTFQMYVYKYLINFKNLRKERAWLFFNL